MSLEINNKYVNIASIILAGGKGTRLFPLTQYHSKPAVSYGGRYKLIDIPISNSLNSNIRQIFVIGQYLTSELQHHLSQTYQFDSFFPGMIDFLTPEELPNGEKIWFDGTADAIRKNLNTIYKLSVDYFLILSGDQLYNINFKKMLEFTIEKDADFTIATIPVQKKEAKRMGILKIDKDSLITDFIEKTTDEKILSSFVTPSSSEENQKYLGSMGIYIFKRDMLESLLQKDKRSDFGKHLIPTALKTMKTAAFIYDGYWEDIGTIQSFFNANMALTSEEFQGLQTCDEKNPIYTRANHLPGTKINNSQIKNSIICEGCSIEAKEISSSIIGLRSTVQEGSIIQNSILLGNEFYSRPQHQSQTMPISFEVGKNSYIKNAIIDEHVFIGNNVTLINKEGHTSYDGDGFYVRDGIIIVTANTRIPDGFVF